MNQPVKKVVAPPPLPQYYSNPGALDALLLNGAAQQVSDIILGDDEPIKMFRYGKVVKLIERPLGQKEVLFLLKEAYGNPIAENNIREGTPVDTAYESKNPGGEPIRWRLNAVTRRWHATIGFRLVFRRIDAIPPLPEEIGLEPELVKLLTTLKRGLIVITGATGSGKSTTMAATLRTRVEDPNDHIHLITLEWPVEYVYDYIPWNNSIVTQLEVGRDVKSFAAGVRNTLRQAPKAILIGEMRDLETIEAGMKAASTGHAVYGTEHTNGAANTLQRMLQEFPAEQKRVAQFDLMSTMHMILAQDLVPTKDGKRMALREFLVLDNDVKKALRDTQDLYGAALKMMKTHGRSFLQDAERHHKAGLISDEEFEKVQATDKLESV